MKYRILAISNYGSVIGGGEHSFVDLITRLPADWSVRVVLPDRGNLLSKLYEKVDGVAIVPASPLRPWRAAAILETLRAYYSLAKRNHINLIYANGSRCALYAGIVGKLLKIPTVWHCRIAQCDRLLDPLLVRLSDSVVANSRATAGRFGSECRLKIRVVYNGFDLAYLQDQSVQKARLLKENCRIVLVVSRISKSKRHDLILKSFEALARSNPDAQLVCIGAPDRLEPEWRNYLEEMTRRSTCSDRIHWIGAVEDVRPWYHAAYVLILASESEGFGRVIVEAMACGLPCVATAAGAPGEIISHGEDGYLVPRADPYAMAAAVERLFREKELRDCLGRAARQKAEFFNLDGHVKEMVAVFSGAIDRKRTAVR